MNDRDIIEEGPKRGRQRCCIVGCGRTFKDTGHTATICGQHWRLGPKDLRTEMTKLERAGKALGWSHLRLERHHEIWEEVRRIANEKSMGI